MTDYTPSRPSPGWVKWLKLFICLSVVALLAAGFWLRWIPGRPVPPEWARGGDSPDNSLSYQTEEDVPSSVAGDMEAVSANRFLFTMGEGKGRHGYDVIQIWPNGRCEYTFPDARTVTASSAATRPNTVPGTTPPAELAPFRRATFSVSPQVVADLRRLLVDIDYFNLKKAYRAPPSGTTTPPPPSGQSVEGVPGNPTAEEDGTQWFVRVQAGSHEKAVWCDNHFPRSIMKLNDFVRTEIVEPNAAARGLATPIDLPGNWLPDLSIDRSAPDELPTGN